MLSKNKKEGLNMLSVIFQTIELLQVRIQVYVCMYGDVGHYYTIYDGLPKSLWLMR